MRIATWNVNSIRTRIDRVEAFLDRHDVDVLAVRETKAKVEQLPLAAAATREPVRPFLTVGGAGARASRDLF